jgi:uncharacterized protein (DUF302 family)
MKGVAMRTKLLAIALLLVASVSQAMAANGLVIRQSRYPVGETIDRLEEAARAGKFQVFARVDFQALAAANGGKVKPNQILIFGRGGILPPLLPAAPTVAIDLPFKFLAWEDGDGKSWLAYNSAAYMKDRHALAGHDEQMKRIDALMAKLAAGVVLQ